MSKKYCLVDLGDTLYVGTLLSALTDDQFEEEAQRLGTVYSEEEFMGLFNSAAIDLERTTIRII